MEPSPSSTTPEASSTPVKTAEFLHLIDVVDNVPSSFGITTPHHPYYTLHLPSFPGTHGFIHPTNLALLPWPASPAFTINHSARTVDLTAATPALGTAAFQAVIDHALTTNAFPQLNGTHSEHIAIPGTAGTITLERFAAPLFGILSTGAHLTAYTRPPGGQPLQIWIARRAASLFSFPNKLDTTVAGGVKAGHTATQCIVEESGEEASLPGAFVRGRAAAVGAVKYVHANAKNSTLNATVLHCFDLELPGDGTVTPRPSDGEVAGFELMGVREVVAAMVGGEFKTNCNLVMLDFFARHGVLEGGSADAEVAARLALLRRRLPVVEAVEG